MRARCTRTHTPDGAQECMARCRGCFQFHSGGGGGGVAVWCKILASRRVVGIIWANGKRKHDDRKGRKRGKNATQLPLECKEGGG